MTVHSYAKINFGLRILGKRPDGFHDLQTVFHRVNLRDTIRFERTENGVTLDTDRSGIPRDRSNLCIRAAELVLRDTPDIGVHIELHGAEFLGEKRIQGSLMGSNRFPVDMPRLVDFYMAGKLKLDEMISRRIKLGQVNEALDELKRGELARSVIMFDA